jgi:hypothetical protein
MKRRSLAGRALQAGALAIGSVVLLCGCGGGARSPKLASLPIVPGARVVSTVRVCDHGANPYCALELVVADPHYASSRLLVLAERNLLKGRRWTGASAATGDELADESPGNKLRINYATAYGDLKDVDLGWIQRTRRTQQALSSEMYAGAVAMSAQVQVGSQ